jgi:hypothetical protein
MNPKVSFLLIAILFQGLISCNNNNSKKSNALVNNNSGIDLISDSGKINEIIDTIPVKSSKQIIGIWESLGKEMLTVDITANTFTYREHHESDKYKFKSDSIYIYSLDFTLSGRPYLINDTFVISMANGELKYVKLKK